MSMLNFQKTFVGRDQNYVGMSPERFRQAPPWPQSLSPVPTDPAISVSTVPVAQVPGLMRQNVTPLPEGLWPMTAGSTHNPVVMTQNLTQVAHPPFFPPVPLPSREEVVAANFPEYSYRCQSYKTFFFAT